MRSDKQRLVRALRQALADAADKTATGWWLVPSYVARRAVEQGYAVHVDIEDWVPGSSDIDEEGRLILVRFPDYRLFDDEPAWEDLR